MKDTSKQSLKVPPVALHSMEEQMDKKEIIRKQFDIQAEKFSSWVGTKNEELLQQLFDFIGIPEGDELLDVGCGSGEVANFYVAEKGRTCGIGNAIVKPSMRGKGVGRFLINTMIDIAKKKYNVKDVTISCFRNNIAGLGLYTQLGFKPDSIDKVKDPDDNIVDRINFKLVI